MAEPKTKTATTPAAPYTTVETKTFKISGPIEITITTSIQSNVPPVAAEPQREAGDFGDALRNVLGKLATMMMQAQAQGAADGSN